jgi:Ni2+-binding GTPase involved in maturation of urease and hydrogenase
MFQKWRDGDENDLLWLKGGPGKGKTMLACEVIDDLRKSTKSDRCLSYYFCRADDALLNNADAVLSAAYCTFCLTNNGIFWCMSRSSMLMQAGSCLMIRTVGMLYTRYSLTAYTTLNFEIVGSLLMVLTSARQTRTCFWI